MSAIIMTAGSAIHSGDAVLAVRAPYFQALERCASAAERVMAGTDWETRPAADDHHWSALYLALAAVHKEKR